MKYILLILSLFSLPGIAQQHVYLFSYFTDNGQDGLHLAFSQDGLNWQALKGGKPFLFPTVGKDKLMRDPYILHGNDGLFHMVWTSSWNEVSTLAVKVIVLTPINPDVLSLCRSQNGDNARNGSQTVAKQ